MCGLHKNILRRIIMCRKLNLLAFLILMLSFFLSSVVNAELIGWWRFDEGSGSTAFDSSGNDHHADVLGTPEWVAGPEGMERSY